jgi:hypothetical protein
MEGQKKCEKFDYIQTQWCLDEITRKWCLWFIHSTVFGQNDCREKHEKFIYSEGSVGKMG